MPREDRTGAYYCGLRARVIREEEACGECGLPVDKALSGKDPWGPTLGHIIPRRRGGPMTRENSQLEHLTCNVAKENRSRAAERRQPTPSRSW